MTSSLKQKRAQLAFLIFFYSGLCTLGTALCFSVYSAGHPCCPALKDLLLSPLLDQMGNYTGPSAFYGSQGTYSGPVIRQHEL